MLFSIIKKINSITNDFLFRRIQLRKKNWNTAYLFNSVKTFKNLLFLNSVNSFTKFFKIIEFQSSSVIFKKHKDFTFNLKLNHDHFAKSLIDQRVNSLKTLYSNRNIQDINSNILHNKYYNNYVYLTDVSNSYKNILLDKIFLKYGSFMLRCATSSYHLNSNNSLINVNFLRKERLYTKLKYSRSPAYDIVSGGSAALLAAFLGFLISEKYGFELVDSGDFYYLFMYVVFLAFSIKPLVYTLNSKRSWIDILSIKPILNFFINILNSFLNYFSKKWVGLQ